jgi:hypothetical protein
MTRSGSLELDRRTLLRGAIVASTLAASPGLARAAMQPHPAVRFVVVDERISESKAFGAALLREGVQRLEVTSGLTAVWRDHLHPHWQRSQGAVVGLTTRSVWDGLSQQAHGQFRKARIVGIHHLAGTVELCQHSIEAPLEANVAHQKLALATARWPQEVARLLARYSNQTGCARESKLYGNAVPAELLRQQLVSWIIE